MTSVNELILHHTPQDIDKYAWIVSVPANASPASTAADLVDRETNPPIGEKTANRNRENDTVFDYTSPDFQVAKGKDVGNKLSEPQALQLVIGKTMREELGEEVAVSFCKNLKCGQLVLVSGRLGTNFHLPLNLPITVTIFISKDTRLQ